MAHYLNCFLACKLIFKTYLLWKTDNQKIRGYELHVAKKNLEIARAMLIVARRRITA